jgi:hypothetical protein
MMLALPKTVRPLIRFGVSAQTILAYSRSGMGGRSPTFRDDTEHPFGSKGAARAGEQQSWAAQHRRRREYAGIVVAVTTSPTPARHADHMTNLNPIPPMAAVLAASARHGGGGVYWIAGWVVVLALIVGAVVYWSRRGRRHREPDNPAHGQRPSRRLVPNDQPHDQSR